MQLLLLVSGPQCVQMQVPGSEPGGFSDAIYSLDDESPRGLEQPSEASYRATREGYVLELHGNLHDIAVPRRLLSGWSDAPCQPRGQNARARHVKAVVWDYPTGTPTVASRKICILVKLVRCWSLGMEGNWARRWKSDQSLFP